MQPDLDRKALLASIFSSVFLVACGGGADGGAVQATPSADQASSAVAQPTQRVTTQSTGQATVTWTAAIGANVSGYRVYYGTSSHQYLQARGTGLLAGSSTAYTVQQLTPGTKYYFSVTSIDTAGDESDYSSEVSMTPQ